MYHRWTKENLEILKLEFSLGDKKKLEEKFQIPWKKIIRKANSLGVFRDKKLLKRAELDILINGSNESFYWLGFILADGHITKKDELKMICAPKDKDHLQKFADYIKYGKVSTDKHGYYRLQTMDKKICPQIKKLLGVSNRKTYNPPDVSIFEKFTDDQLLSLFIGHVDGDGHIKKNKNRNDFQLAIFCHLSWASVLKYWCERIYKIFNCENKQKQYTVFDKFKNYTYGYLCITKTKVLQNLTKFAIDKNIPFLKRKWERIDLNFVTFFEKNKELAQKTFKLFKLGVPRIEMVEILQKNKMALDYMMTAYGISSRQLKVSFQNILKIKKINKSGEEFFYKSAYDVSKNLNICLDKISKYLFENEIDEEGCTWKFIYETNFIGNLKNL